MEKKFLINEYSEELGVENTWKKGEIISITRNPDKETNNKRRQGDATRMR